MNLTFHLKLKHYLIFGVSAIIFITSLILLLFPTISYTRLYEEQTKNYCRNFSLQVATDLTNSLEQYEQKIDALVDNPTLRSFFQPEADFSDSTYQYIHLISDIFRKDSLDGYYLQEIDCYLLDTAQCLSYGSNPIELSSITESPYYSRALLMPTTLNWIGYNRDSDSMEISRIIYDYSTYRPIGLMVIRLSTAFFSDILAKYDQENIEQINIINNYGVLLAPAGAALPSPDLKSLSSSVNSGMVDSSKEWFIYSKLKDTSAKFPYDKWTVLVSVKKSTILQNYKYMEVLFLLTAAVITMIGIFITVKFSARVTAPIGKLAEAMIAVQHGDLDMAVKEDSHIDEINEMCHGFNQMTDQLNQLVNTVYKNKLAEKEAQLKALRAQINPHFLFNTLQLIGLKAHEFEAYEICDMISSLSYMLEADLYTGDEEHFTLRNELEYIRHYITIIKQKYKEKISFHIDVEPECLACKIPKMILQPFVENAVIHGIAPKTCPGTIQITISGSQSDLLFQIRDDGVGMHNDTLIALQTGETPSSLCSKGHRIALKNIQNRIHLLYGEEYGFTVDSQLYKGTSVKLKLPYRKETQTDG